MQRTVRISGTVPNFMTSIMMVAFQVFTIQDVANGLLIYIGQAFLLAGSIFGLDYYIDKMKYILTNNKNTL